VHVYSLQVQLDVAGLPVLLSDTAGLRAAAAAADDVEREGIKRAMVLRITHIQYNLHARINTSHLYSLSNWR
jgi:tRNA U34 5-carboxymethylaminomethyl modifying GTPase MnmE/TrmE